MHTYESACVCPYHEACRDLSALQQSMDVPLGIIVFFFFYLANFGSVSKCIITINCNELHVIKKEIIWVIVLKL